MNEIRAAAAKTENVRFALGMCYVDEKSKVKTALRTADERMYGDKRLYYEHHKSKMPRKDDFKYGLG